MPESGMFRSVRSKSGMLCFSLFLPVHHQSLSLSPKLVEVFAKVPLGVSCFLSCGVGGYFVPILALGRRLIVSSRHSAAGGRRVMRARVVLWRSGASGTDANAVDKKTTLLECFQKKKALAAVKALTRESTTTQPEEKSSTTSKEEG